ncbi:YdcF family protein [Motiliproteus sp.]|uniref:YdcF family protein n=1 Tax=Motiliproteus sp. TaxID=1898955 RepID=UPI003BABF806
MDNLFYMLSKVIWTFARPDHLLLLIMTLAVLVLGWNTQRRQARLFAWLSLAMIWLVALVPVGQVFLHQLEQRFPPPGPLQSQSLSGIIVLGGAEQLASMRYHRRAEFTDAADRILAVPQLAMERSDLPIVYSCGSGWHTEPEIRGADFTKLYFDAIGLEDRVLYEREARNTYENGTLSRELVRQQLGESALEGRWLLVTSAFHMPRSVGVFRQQGWDVLPYPVDYRGQPLGEDPIYFNLSSNLQDLMMASREWVGLLAYWLTDKTYRFLPGDESEQLALQPGISDS